MLPALTIAWALFKNLNTDVILTVIALHSLMFAYLGGSRRESPYHAIAVMGFVSFILILLTRLASFPFPLADLCYSTATVQR